MDTFVRGMVRAVAETFPFPGPILEVGSYQVQEQEDLIDMRPFFPGRQFTGVDFRAGPGVDLVADVEDLPLPDQSVGTVLGFNVFEHVKHFWKGLEEIERVLRPDGVVLLSCPFYFHVHDYPNDYWRFTPEAFRMMFERFPHKLIGYHGPKTRPRNVWIYASRAAGGRITDAQYQLYSARMDEYAKLSMPWYRRLRYAVGRMICGSRPFAPYFQREDWGSDVYDDADERAIPSEERVARAA